MSENHAGALILRPQVVVTVIEDGAVLLDLDTKYFYSVNQVGWAILQLFEAGTTRERVETRCREWGASADDLVAISRFIEILVGDNLVTHTDAGAEDIEIRPVAGWSPPTIEKAREPLQRIIKSPFDPTLPLAE